MGLFDSRVVQAAVQEPNTCRVRWPVHPLLSERMTNDQWAIRKQHRISEHIEFVGHAQ